MKTTVDQLLSLSRLPVHFWTELNGGKPNFDNPGSSIMSYAVLKLSHEIVDVPNELQPALEECTDFTRKTDSINHIFTWLTAMTTQAIAAASKLPDKVKADVFKETNDLMAEHTKLKGLYETLAGSDGKLPPLFDNTSQVGKMFMQSLINTKLLMRELLQCVTDAKNPAPTPEPA